MRHQLYVFWLCLLWATSVVGQDPDDELTAILVEGKLVETMAMETGPATLVVDVTRTKIGRDFYEAFYQQWSNASVAALPSSGFVPDSVSKAGAVSAALNASEYLITVEDLPLPGNGFTSSVSIIVDDQLLFQQFLPARRDVIEEFAGYAVAVVQGYFAELQSVQMQLNNEDQRGTGLY